jgi:hypothetical protein
MMGTNSSSDGSKPSQRWEQTLSSFNRLWTCLVRLKHPFFACSHRSYDAKPFATFGVEGCNLAHTSLAESEIYCTLSGSATYRLPRLLYSFMHTTKVLSKSKTGVTDYEGSAYTKTSCIWTRANLCTSYSCDSGFLGR